MTLMILMAMKLLRKMWSLTLSQLLKTIPMTAIPKKINIVPLNSVVRCDVCSTYVRTEEGKIEHMKEYHEDFVKFECNTCIGKWI